MLLLRCVWRHLVAGIGGGLRTETHIGRSRIFGQLAVVQPSSLIKLISSRAHASTFVAPSFCIHDQIWSLILSAHASG